MDCYCRKMSLLSCRFLSAVDSSKQDCRQFFFSTVTCHQYPLEGLITNVTMLVICIRIESQVIMQLLKSSRNLALFENKNTIG